MDKLIDNTKLQDVWFEWILNQMFVDKKCFFAIRKRWSKSRQIYLEYFAPYAWVSVNFSGVVRRKNIIYQ